MQVSEGLKELKDCLLNFANYKPKKKDIDTDKVKKQEIGEINEKSFKLVLEKIV